MLTLVEAMNMLADEEEGADSEAVEVVFAEIDRLRADCNRLQTGLLKVNVDRDREADRLQKELRKARVAARGAVGWVNLGAYDAETDRLCGGPEKGAEG